MSSGSSTPVMGISPRSSQYFDSGDSKSMDQEYNPPVVMEAVDPARVSAGKTKLGFIIRQLIESEGLFVQDLGKAIRVSSV